MIDLMKGSSGVAPTLCHLGRLVQDEQILVEMSMTGRDMMILALVSLRHNSDDDPPVW